jgi:hypothetical protein
MRRRVVDLQIAGAFQGQPTPDDAVEASATQPYQVLAFLRKQFPSALIEPNHLLSGARDSAQSMAGPPELHVRESSGLTGAKQARNQLAQARGEEQRP